MLTSLALVFLVGLALAALCQKLKLPRIIGMLATGILLGPCVLNVLDGSILSISADLRKLTLVIILLKAGLSLDLGDLKKVGRPAILMSCLPATCEIIGYVLLAPCFLGITRAEAAAIFFRLLTDDVRDENLTKTNRYSDVAATSWYNTAVSTLSSMGIITGYSDGTFGPQRDITRAETMTLVNRVLNRQPETEDDLLPNMTVWTDNANPKAWYYLAVQEATNSHYYKFKTNSKYEKWTELRETRDWTQLEK